MLTIFSLFLFTPCGNKNEEKEEIKKYNNENWVPVNKMRKEKMNEPQTKLSKLEDEGKEKEAIAVIENEIITILDDIQNEFKDVELQHKKVKKLNDLETEAEEFLKDSMTEVVIHYNNGNISEEDNRQNNIEIEEKFLKVTDYRY